MFSLRSNSIAVRYRSQLGGSYLQIPDMDSKAKATMDSLRSLSFARFARSRCIGLHENIDFLGFKALKSGFSRSLGANFRCVARRHSLITD